MRRGRALGLLALLLAKHPPDRAGYAFAFDALVAFRLLAGTGVLVEWAIRKSRRAT